MNESQNNVGRQDEWSPQGNGNAPGGTEPPARPAEMFSGNAYSSTTPTPAQPWSPSPAPGNPSVYAPVMQGGTMGPVPQGGQFNGVPQGDFGQPIVNGPGQAQSYTAPPHQRRGKGFKLAAGFLAGVLLLAGTGGYVFGYYLPNLPENVWKKGLDRSGQAFESLVLEATDEQARKGYRGSEITGSIEVDSEEFKLNGTVESKFDAATSDTSYNVSFDGPAGKDQKFGMEVLSELSEGSSYPDIYFKYTGLAALGADTYLPGTKDFEGKWIAVSSNFLNSILPVGAKEDAAGSLTSKDAVELVRAASAATREYVLTSDPAKSVLVQKEFIAAEELEGGIVANHYLAGLHKQNAKAYCRALVEKVMSAAAYKKLPGVNADSIDEDKKTAAASCDEEVEREIKQDDTFDIWIDKKYKLIHKVRVSDKKNNKDYIELGQSYRGGNELPMFLVVNSESNKVFLRADVTTNKTSKTTKTTLSLESKGETPLKADAALDFKPRTGPVSIKKPRNTVPVETVLDTFGIDPALLAAMYGGERASTVQSGGSLAAKAKDSERKADLNALVSYLESYAASKGGRYPGLSEFNNTTWRAINLQGLDLQAFQDPDGVSQQLAATATATQYGYSASGCSKSGTQCRSYEITAILSDGSVYRKRGLNRL